MTDNKAKIEDLMKQATNRLLRRLLWGTFPKKTTYAIITAWIYANAISKNSLFEVFLGIQVNDRNPLSLKSPS